MSLLHQAPITLSPMRLFFIEQWVKLRPLSPLAILKSQRTQQNLALIHGSEPHRIKAGPTPEAGLQPPGNPMPHGWKRGLGVLGCWVAGGTSKGVRICLDSHPEGLGADSFLPSFLLTCLF